MQRYDAEKCQQPWAIHIISTVHVVEAIIQVFMTLQHKMTVTYVQKGAVGITDQ